MSFGGSFSSTVWTVELNFGSGVFPRFDSTVQQVHRMHSAALLSLHSSHCTPHFGGFFLCNSEVPPWNLEVQSSSQNQICECWDAWTVKFKQVRLVCTPEAQLWSSRTKSRRGPMYFSYHHLWPLKIAWYNSHKHLSFTVPIVDACVCRFLVWRRCRLKIWIFLFVLLQSMHDHILKSYDGTFKWRDEYVMTFWCTYRRTTFFPFMEPVSRKASHFFHAWLSRPSLHSLWHKSIHLFNPHCIFWAHDDASKIGWDSKVYYIRWSGVDVCCWMIRWFIDLKIIDVIIFDTRGLCDLWKYGWFCYSWFWLLHSYCVTLN